MVENPYFGLFKGEDVSYNAVTTVCPGMSETINALVRGGSVVGQYTLENDIILWMPKKRRDINLMKGGGLNDV